MSIERNRLYFFVNADFVTDTGLPNLENQSLYTTLAIIPKWVILNVCEWGKDDRRLAGRKVADRLPRQRKNETTRARNLLCFAVVSSAGCLFSVATVDKVSPVFDNDGNLIVHDNHLLQTFMSSFGGTRYCGADDAGSGGEGLHSLDILSTAAGLPTALGDW